MHAPLSLAQREPLLSRASLDASEQQRQQQQASAAVSTRLRQLVRVGQAAVVARYAAEERLGVLCDGRVGGRVRRGSREK